MPPSRAVAACFSGWQGRAVPDGGESIRRYLVRPLKADVLLALGYSDRDGCDSAATCRIHERLAALAPFARVSLLRQLSLEELLPLMEGLAHWPSVLRTYNHARRRLSCVRNPEWRSLSCGSDNPQCTGSPGCREGACRGGPYNCTGILYGNSIFAPVIGSPSIQSLPMLRGVQQCLELIEAQEEARRRLSNPHP